MCAICRSLRGTSGCLGPTSKAKGRKAAGTQSMMHSMTQHSEASIRAVQGPAQDMGMRILWHRAADISKLLWPPGQNGGTCRRPTPLNKRSACPCNRCCCLACFKQLASKSLETATLWDSPVKVPQHKTILAIYMDTLSWPHNLKAIGSPF